MSESIHPVVFNVGPHAVVLHPDKNTVVQPRLTRIEFDLLRELSIRQEVMREACKSLRGVALDLCYPYQYAWDALRSLERRGLVTVRRGSPLEIKIVAWPVEGQP
jgi:hypothetical protein